MAEKASHEQEQADEPGKQDVAQKEKLVGRTYTTGD